MNHPTANQQSTPRSLGSGSSVLRSEAKNAACTLFDVVRQLTRENASDRRVWAAVLEHIRKGWDSPFAAVRVVTDRGMTHEESIDENTHAGIWSPLANSELTQAVVDGKPSSRVYRDPRSGVSIVVHSVPIPDRLGSPCGAIGVVTDQMPDTFCLSAQKQLASYVDLVVEAGWLSESSTSANDPIEDASVDTGTTENTNGDAGIDFLSATIAAEFRSAEELAFSLTNSIKTRLNCIEVGFGVVRKEHIRLLAISGTDNVFRNTPGAERITQVMEECLDNGNTVYAQTQSLDDEESGARALPIHRAWRAATQGTNCISIPLGEAGSANAVISLRRAEGRPFVAEELSQLRAQLASIGAAIEIVTKARRGLLSHTANAIGGYCKWVVGHSLLRRTLAAAVIIVLAAALFLPWPYQIMVDAKINSTEGRVYAAPVDGRLDKVHVKPGEKIYPGQLLFEMDVRDLEADLAGLQSEFSLHRIRLVDALRNHANATATAEQELACAVELEIREAERKIGNAKVFSEEAGVVTKGDGHLRTGEMLAFGVPIVEVANSEGCDVELKVADHLAADLAPGMTGWFAGQGEPERRRDLVISRLERQATIEEGRNLLSVWATLDEPADDLPVGATGFTQVTVGSRPGWWLLLHKPLRKLRWQLIPL
ncbi:MAG: biotin/lipoyl-binding protein [Rubripirellula sp.]|nr:biotin/lipoyl-binding protein [Rubripirellula sp.]